MPEQILSEVQIISLTEEYAEKNADKILALEHNWKEIGDDPWNINNLMYQLPNKWELSHAALLGGQIIGYQIGSLRDGKAFLNKIIIDREIRKTGAGKKLLKAFLEKANKLKLKNIIFRARIDNPAVIFYEKLGFKKDAELDRTRADGVESYFYNNVIKEILKNMKDD